MNPKKLLLLPLFFVFFVKSALAHCPLCTAGAAVAVGGATLLGVNKVVIGLFIGAFGISTGWMGAKWLKRKFIPGQDWILIISAFLLTIVPLLPIFGEVSPFNVFIMGGYGTLLNRTYMINLPLMGSIAGGAIVCITPWLSKKITDKRGKMIPFQGILLTFGLLMISALIVQLGMV